MNEMNSIEPEMPAQPPPGIPAPPPGIEAVRSRRKMRVIVWIGVSSILLLLAYATQPRLITCGKKSAALTRTLSNVRQIGMALFDFDGDYAQFPDTSTIPSVKASKSSNWDLKADTSNDLFRQLILSGAARSEDIFYVKQEGTRKPDNVMSSEAEALKEGECAFSYILPGPSGGGSGRPILVLGLIPGTLRFDPKVMEGKAVILRLDQSAIAYPIRPDGRVFVNGMDLFDPRQPFWGGTAPVVKWPKLLASAPPPIPVWKRGWFLMTAGIVTVAAAWVLHRRHSQKKGTIE